MRVAAACLAMIVAAGCSAAPLPAAAPLALHRERGDRAQSVVGAVGAAIVHGGRVVLFGERGVAVIVAGAVVATDDSVRGWSSAAVIPALTGAGDWLVGIDGDGRLRRVRALLTLEDISERFGLAHGHARFIAAYGGRGVAVAVDDALVVADGRSVTRFEAGAATALAGGAGRIVVVVAGALRAYQPESNHWVSYPLRGVVRVAIDSEGRLVAATARALYREDEHGALALRHEAATAIGALTTAGAVTWFIADGEIGSLTASTVALTHGAHLADTAILAVADTPGVWTAHGSRVSHWMLDAPRSAPDTDASAPVATPSELWTSTVQPVFARACVPCHLPGGEADIDLSSYDTWRSRRDALRDQVIVSHAMPPRGHALADADREALRTWLDRPAD